MKIQTQITKLEQRVGVVTRRRERFDTARPIRFLLMGKPKALEDRPSHAEYEEFARLTCSGEPPGKERRDKVKWCLYIKSIIDKANGWRD